MDIKSNNRQTGAGIASTSASTGASDNTSQNINTGLNSLVMQTLYYYHQQYHMP